MLCLTLPADNYCVQYAAVTLIGSVWVGRVEFVGIYIPLDT